MVVKISSFLVEFDMTCSFRTLCHIQFPKPVNWISLNLALSFNFWVKESFLFAFCFSGLTPFNQQFCSIPVFNNVLVNFLISH